MCKYCEGTGKDLIEICEKDIDFGVLGNAGLALDMAGDNLLVSLTGKGWLDVQIEIENTIKYCPFCGRKLK